MAVEVPRLKGNYSNFELILTLQARPFPISGRFSTVRRELYQPDTVDHDHETDVLRANGHPFRNAPDERGPPSFCQTAF